MICRKCNREINIILVWQDDTKHTRAEARHEDEPINLIEALDPFTNLDIADNAYSVSYKRKLRKELEKKCQSRKD